MATVKHVPAEPQADNTKVDLRSLHTGPADIWVSEIAKCSGLGAKAAIDIAVALGPKLAASPSALNVRTELMDTFTTKSLWGGRGKKQRDEHHMSSFEQLFKIGALGDKGSSSTKCPDSPTTRAQVRCTIARRVARAHARQSKCL